MSKFKAIKLADLAQIIPEWKELAKKSPLDLDNLAVMYDTIHKYGEQNGMTFFQIHHRMMDSSPIVIYTLKE